MNVKMASKKNKQKNKTSKTRQLFNENKQENYQSQLLKELKNSIAANKELINFSIDHFKWIHF